jgi:hypothetical protein
VQLCPEQRVPVTEEVPGTDDHSDAFDPVPLSSRHGKRELDDAV